MSDREWKQADDGEKIEKFGDVRSQADRYRLRHLPPTATQVEPTSEILAQREAKENFKIKRVK